MQKPNLKSLAPVLRHASVLVLIVQKQKHLVPFYRVQKQIYRAVQDGLEPPLHRSLTKSSAQFQPLEIVSISLLPLIAKRQAVNYLIPHIHSVQMQAILELPSSAAPCENQKLGQEYCLWLDRRLPHNQRLRAPPTSLLFLLLIKIHTH